MPHHRSVLALPLLFTVAMAAPSCKTGSTPALAKGEPAADEAPPDVQSPPADGPKLLVLQSGTIVYDRPSTSGRVLGELRTGAQVARSRDAAVNLAMSYRQSFKTALDTRPPKILDISVEKVVRGSGSEARGQIVVTWKTDEPSTSQVQYAEGASATELNNQSIEDGNLTTEHVAIISDLSPSKAYNVRPVSRDKGNNLGVGGSQSIIIGRATDSVISIIFNTLQRMFGFNTQ